VVTLQPVLTSYISIGLQALRVAISCTGEIMEKLKSAATCPNLSKEVLWSTISNMYVLVFN